MSVGPAAAGMASRRPAPSERYSERFLLVMFVSPLRFRESVWIESSVLPGGRGHELVGGQAAQQAVVLVGVALVVPDDGDALAPVAELAQGHHARVRVPQG